MTELRKLETNQNDFILVRKWLGIITYFCWHIEFWWVQSILNCIVSGTKTYLVYHSNKLINIYLSLYGWHHLPNDVCVDDHSLPNITY